MIHSAVNIRETQNSTSSAYYSIHVYNVVPTNNFFLYALIDIPMHVFVAVFIVITPRLHNSQNNFLFLRHEPFLEGIIRIFSHFLGIKGDIRTGWREPRPCCHAHTTKTSSLFSFSVYAQFPSLSLSLSLPVFPLETQNWSFKYSVKKMVDQKPEIRHISTQNLIVHQLLSASL